MGLFRKKKSYPDYWEEYVSHFEKSQKQSLEQKRFVALDTETTGFDFDKDRLLCIGAISISANEIRVSETFEIYIQQEYFNPETVEIHGIIRNTKIETVTEEDAIIQFLKYTKDAVLVAHHAVFDIKMINMALKRLGLPKLKNRVLDTVTLYDKTRIKSNILQQRTTHTLDDIADNYTIDLSDRHTAAGDALITAFIFLKTTHTLNKSKHIDLKSLFVKANRF